MPPFHRELVRGVAAYAYELLSVNPGIKVFYVRIGCDSGICGCISVRDILGLDTRIVGVVSELTQTANLSPEAGRIIETNSARTFGDGVAVRVPVQAAFDNCSKGGERITTVSEKEIVGAIRVYLRDINNLAKGAGAAAFAALMLDRDRNAGRVLAVILSVGNISTNWFFDVMQGRVRKI